MVYFTSSDNFTRAIWSRPKIRATFPAMLRQRQKFRRTYIREWRKFRGLTLEQLGERIELTESNLSMLERGERGYSQETLEAIADALQTDVASLLMRNPLEPEAIWSLWDKAKPGEKRQIVEITKALLKTGTDP